MFEKLIVKLSGIDCSKKNPIDYDILLRSPGQSLNEELEKIKDRLLEKVFKAFLVALLGILTVIVFDLSLYFEMLFVLIPFMYSILLLSKNIVNMRNYKLGRDGERSVAQYLSIVARQVSKENSNMHIYHDLVNEKKKFNIDHVVVSKKGIFIVETKTYRKDKDITNKITSNGKELFKNAYKMTNNISLQVKGQVQWLQSELLQTTGKKYEIISTIAFVGWYVEGDKINDIYITQAKTLKNIFEHQYSDVIYDNEELKRITSCIHKLATVTNKKHIDICK